MRLLLLLLCACNRIVGVADTVLHDAPPPDAPFACPAPGMPLAFSPLLHEWLIADCFDFTTDATGTRALAGCAKLSEGPAEGPLTPVKFETTKTIEMPRLAPDGNAAYVRASTSAGVYELERFVRHPDGVWRFDSALPQPEADKSVPSTIANPGSGDRMMYYQYSTSMISEWSAEGGTWHVVGSYTAASLGLEAVDATIDFGFDGLRMLVLGQATGERPGVYYATRAQVTDSFTNAQRLNGLPYVQLPFMSADCARVYVYGLGRIFYVQQQ